MTVARVLEVLRQDAGFAFRTLAKTPAFASAATLTLALGIGANVAMFSIVYVVVLKPLPYRNPDDLLLIQGETAVSGTRRPLAMSVRLSEFDSWRAARTFEPPVLFT